MDSEDTAPSTSRVQCCNSKVTCLTMNRSYSGTWLRSVKRKLQEHEVKKEGFSVPGLDVLQVAKVELGNECVMLREMVTSQQHTIDDLLVELEKERNASSSSANEAMSMILRLQREKAEVQMDLRQFKRFAEDKIVHDAEEVSALEELLYKREQLIESLTYEMQAYKHRMLSYNLTDFEAEGKHSVMRRYNSTDIPTYDYPPIKCNSYVDQLSAVNTNVVDVEKQVSGDPTCSPEQLRDLEDQIYQLEQNPTQNHHDVDVFGTKNVVEKVIVGHSPRQYKHGRRSSNDSLSSIPATINKTSTDVACDLCSTKKKEYAHIRLEDSHNVRKIDTNFEVGDDMSNIIHTVDYAQHGVPNNSVTEPKATAGLCKEYMTRQTEPLSMGGELGGADVQKLYTRLQALEADRESLRQALISMGTEKAQLVLLKEIAQRLCQDMLPAKKLHVRKTYVSRSLSILSLFKLIVSFVFRRKKARPSRYMSGMFANNIGLLTLLDKGPRVRQWRSVSSTKI